MMTCETTKPSHFSQLQKIVMVHPVPSTALSADVVKAAIQVSCAKASAKNEALSFESLVEDKVKDLFAVLNIQVSKRALDELDKYHGVTLARDGGVVGGATFYFAYSTWDGRILYVDKIEAKNNGDEEHILRLLGDVAVQLECQRLVWQVSRCRPFFGLSCSLPSLSLSYQWCRAVQALRRKAGLVRKGTRGAGVGWMADVANEQGSH